MTFAELIRRRCEERPDQLAYRYLADDGSVTEWTYRQLGAASRAIAAELRESGRSGERAILLYPSGFEFAAAFYGCLLAGTVAVPSYPIPGSERLAGIAADAGAKLVLTCGAMLEGRDAFAQAAAELGRLEWIVTDELDPGGSLDWEAPGVSPETLALLQYTSGSTSTPKGVMVSQANLLANEAAVEERFGNDSATHMVSWLPIYHDMGLIGGMLHPLYLGGSCTLMEPLSFLRRPLRWLEAISRYRGTVSGAPNFGYELCVRKLRPEDLEELDLSSWAVAFNGAEPVRAATLERFSSAFEPFGFAPEALYPTYGLAEATLLVTGIERGERPSWQRLGVGSPAENRLEAAAGEEERVVVSCGRPASGHTVAIVDPETRRRCSPRQIGEIWVTGPSVASGYWERQEETTETFGALIDGGDGTPHLRTGDLGFLSDGELFVTGRRKDLIILRGRNLYPHDIELTVEEAHPAVRPGCCAAFSLDAIGDERVAVAAEVLGEEGERDDEAIIAAVRSRVAEEHGVSLHTVALLAPRTIPKTSSGKIRRRACRQRLLEGTLATVAVASRQAEVPAEGESTRGSAVEGLVRSAVGQLLGVDPGAVEMAAAPAAVGLDSLMAVELQARIEEAFDLTLRSGYVWQHETLAALVKGVIEARPDAGTRAVAAAPSPPASEPTELPASSGQERLWFLDRLSPGSPAYNVHFGLRISGPLDREALRRCLSELVARHTVLRTVLQETEDGLQQMVGGGAEVSLRQFDLTGLTGAALDEELDALARRIASEPFDLEAGPLIRFDLAAVGAGEQEHVLLVTQHHVVTDGHSAALLTRELVELYDARVSGATPPAPPRHGYADFCRWERASAGDDEDREYWRQQLENLPALELPADRRPAEASSGRGGRVSFALRRAEIARLLETGREEGCTPYVTLLAAFAALLGRLSGQEDFAVGTVIANRDRPELRSVVGFLANTVAIRVDLTGSPTLREFLRRTRATVSAALGHAALPLGEVVRLRGAARAGGENLFDVSFVFESTAPRRLEAAGASWEAISWAPDGAVEGTAKFGLSLAIEQRGGDFACALEYDADRFDATTGEALAKRFSAFVATLADGPRPLTTLPVVEDEERRRLLHDWNATAADLPLEAPFARLFARQVERDPGAVAVVEEGRQLSYAELDDRAARLAHRLRETGVGHETLVALLMPRGVGLLASVLAAFKLGAAYVPLDPNYPVKRQLKILERSGATHLVASGELAASLRSAGGENGGLAVEIVASEEIDGLGPAPEGLEAEATARDTAYVIFTSGSTGEPKGVVVEQRGMVNHLFAKIRDLELTAADTVAQTASQCFDISVWQLLAPLLVGGRVRVMRDEDVQDPARLLRRVAAEGVSVLELVPSALRAALEEPGEETAAALGSLRCLMLTGEALSADLARRWLERFPEIPIVNAYGPTECSDDVTHERIDTVAALAGAGVALGRPLLNTRMYVLDRSLELVPPVATGELCAAGAGVGRGYLGDPALTAERFVPDPFSGVPGARMYRTGDVGRWLPDGRLEFAGRVDQQVKVRGFRVELGEIEAELDELAGVRQAAVVACEGASGGTRLVAYVVPEGELAVAAVQEELRSRLPGYMVPAAIVALEQLPLTANGKLDRRALPEVEWTRPQGMDALVAPRGPVEELVATVWEELLGIAGIGAEDDFFELGGHSLLATRVVTRLRAATGVEVPLRRLFEAPTVAALARFVVAEKGGSAKPPEAIERGSRAGPLPLSSAQSRLWFLDQLNPGDPAYNVVGAVWIRGPLREEALAGALAEVARRHESLRTTFTVAEGEPSQRISPAGGIELELESIAEGDLERRLAEFAREPFDLGSGPLARARLLRLGEQDHVLTLGTHHIVSDGWSLGVMLREVSALYRSLGAGEPSPLPEPPIQYADYARWQRRRLGSGELDGQLEYWRRRLAEAPPALELPTDHPRSPLERGPGAQHPIEIDATRLRGLRALSRQCGTTLYMTLLAGLQTLLARLSGQRDILIGSPIAGRMRPDLEGLIGFFVNTLVIRADLSDDPTFAELLARTRESCIDAYANQEVPFEKLVEALAPRRDLARTPFFGVMFALQNVPAAPLELVGTEVEELPLASARAKFDLTLSLREEGEVLRGYLEYDSDLFEPESAARMACAYLSILDRVLENPDLPTAAIPLLDPAEREHLLRCAAGPEAMIPEEPIHVLFERQAAARPEAAAVIGAGGERLSYAELNASANRLARELRERGAGGLESTVAILLEPSAEMLIALLAVLKAGAAFLPIDPATPGERIEHMLADSAAAAVLTTAAQAERLPRAPLALVLDEASDAFSRHGDANLDLPSALSSRAYTIYTSGSTGRPKGVGVEHRQILAYLTAITARLGLGLGWSYAMVQPLSVDACMTVLLPAICTGGTLHALPRAVATDPEALASHFSRHEVDVLKIAPSHFSALLDAHPSRELFPRRVLVLGGEATSRGWVARQLWPLAPPDCGIFVHYGPTETTVGTLVHPIERRESRQDGLVPIGRPLAGARVHVLDQTMEPVPIGVVGEIWIGGDSVARGYVGSPALTAERFLPDPFAIRPGARLYRSGDLGRRLASGEVEFVGRADRQVKVRGFRVELSEIEAVFEEHPEVGRVAVVARSDAAAGARLAAYVVPARGVSAGPGEDRLGSLPARLREHASGRLPDYMTPSSLTVLEALPLNAHGKLDVRGLPDPSVEAAALRQPRTLLEARLAAIWEEVLGVGPIGIDDDFFELGGHSLLAMRMVALVHEQIGGPVPLAALFQGPTVARFARQLSRPAVDRDERAIVPLQEGEGPPLFCVHPVGGDVLCYAGLTRALGRGRGVLGIRALEGDDAPETIEAMATRYLEEVVAAEPSGPYLLAGWSMGGVIAFEMARQLVAAGREVGMLALLDTHLPPRQREPDPAGDDTLPVARFAFDLARVAGLDLSELREELESRDRDGQMEMVWEVLEGEGLLRDDATRAELDRRLAMFERNALALATFSVPRFEARVLFLGATDGSGPRALADELASRAGAEVETHAVPGDHYAMLDRENVGVVAELLGQRMDGAGEGSGPGTVAAVAR